MNEETTHKMRATHKASGIADEPAALPKGTGRDTTRKLVACAAAHPNPFAPRRRAQRKPE